MRALLTVGDILLAISADQQTGIVFGRIAEHQGFANRQTGVVSDPANLRLAASATEDVLKSDRQLPDDERQAGQAQELGEISSCEIHILRPVDGKILPPFWLQLHRLSVGRN